MVRIQKRSIDDMLPEYDLSGGVRGKYYERYQTMKLKVMLDPDVAAMFPDSLAVNEALRALARRDQPRGGGAARRRKAG